MKLFSPDSKFMRAMSTLGDLMLLNLVFLLCCVPVITVGASAAALDTAVFRLSRDRGGQPLAVFFRAFRDNFRPATLLWLVLLLGCGVILLDIRLLSGLQGAPWLLRVPFLLLLVLIFFTGGYAFPLLSQFENSLRQTLKNALILSLGCLPRTLLITALNLFPFALLYYDLYTFLSVGFLWVFLYFAAAAFLIAKLMEKVFAPYRSEEEEE